MPRMLLENALIRYWVASCHEYRLSSGARIRRAQANEPYSRFPDIRENHLDNGRTVPCEIEWASSDFLQHKHDIGHLKRLGGFVVVVERDFALDCEQVEIRQASLEAWAGRQGRDLAKETIAAVRSDSIRAVGTSVWMVYRPLRARRNFEVAREMGIWGVKEQQRDRSVSRLKEVRKGDIVVFLHEHRAGLGQSGRVPVHRFRGAYAGIDAFVVTDDYHYSDSKVWEDDVYPHRFRFKNTPFFVGGSLVVKPGRIGKDLHALLHRLNNNQALVRIDPGTLVRMMTLCVAPVSEQNVGSKRGPCGP
jgi:hypothetical protein